MKGVNVMRDARILTVVMAVTLAITLTTVQGMAVGQDRPPHHGNNQSGPSLDQNMNHPAIEAKYAALKGSAGFLGLPTSPTTKAPDRFGYYRHYQGGSIFYTPKTGARVVRGAIREKYAALEWQKGFLRYPTTDELTASDGIGAFSHFMGGVIYWSPATGAQEVHGEILRKWNALGTERGLLGYPLTSETKTPDGAGRYNHFERGSIYWSPNTGAHEIHGYIREKWARLGWELGSLGYPLTDEMTAPDGTGRYNHFVGGSIYWTPDTGAHAVAGKIRDKWADLGWEQSSLGYPITDELTVSFNTAGVTRLNKFQSGAIRISPTGNVYVIADVWTKVPIQAILLRDDNGSNAAEIDGSQVIKWIVYANAVFAPGKIRFTFNPERDCETLNSTDLNQRDLPWAKKDKANEIAARYPGKIVVFFRARAAGNGYSWGPEEGINFIAMPGFTATDVCGHQNLGQLAHDLGHYLGLPHTFPGKSDFSKVSEARDWLKSNGHFDGDGFGDTPEDPGRVVTGQCGPTPTTVMFEGRLYAPPRTNVMSYYSDLKTDFDKSPLIQILSPQQFDRVYEVLKIRKLM